MNLDGFVIVGLRDWVLGRILGFIIVYFIIFSVFVKLANFGFFFNGLIYFY